MSATEDAPSAFVRKLHKTLQSRLCGSACLFLPVPQSWEISFFLILETFAR